jgi:hypothetical protein
MGGRDRAVHIIEPTLRDQAGHCFSFVDSVLEAGREGGVTRHVWVHAATGPLFDGHGACVEHHHFRGGWRRLQAGRLYRALLGSGEPFLVATATTTDLLTLGLLARHLTGTGRAYAYVHWYRPSWRRRRIISWTARRAPGLEILCATETVQRAFQEAGCRRARHVPYPRPVRAAPRERAVTDEPGHVLYAGAARADKGFPVIVDLVAELAAEGSALPVVVQCSTTHRGRHAGKIEGAIDRLRGIAYGPLRTIEHTLDESAYANLFANAITVQPYDAGHFADRVSGVALDALHAGSPLVVPEATWMARQVERYEAGVSVRDASSCAEIRSAIDRVAADWPRYARNAQRAGRELAERHDARRLWDVITGDDGTA